MAGTVRLKHITRKNSWIHHWYSGFAHVTNGVIELPADDFVAIRRAWVFGFRLTEDGQHIRAAQFNDIVAQATVDSPEEPVNEQENSSSGRQSRSTDRVRESESDSSGKTTKRRSRSRVRSGAGVSE